MKKEKKGGNIDNDKNGGSRREGTDKDETGKLY